MDIDITQRLGIIVEEFKIAQDDAMDFVLWERDAVAITEAIEYIQQLRRGPNV